MHILVIDLYHAINARIRENDFLLEILNKAAAAKPPRTRVPSWDPIPETNHVYRGPIGRAEKPIIFTGLNHFLTLGFLSKHADKLRFIRKHQIISNAPEVVLTPSDGFEGLADMILFDPGPAPEGYDLYTLVREHLLYIGKSREHLYRFLSTRDWSVDTREIADNLRDDFRHDRMELGLELDRMPNSREIASLVDFSGHPDERFAKAWRYTFGKKDPVTKAELAEHCKLTVENKAFAILWDQLSRSGANIQGRGRPRKK